MWHGPEHRPDQFQQIPESDGEVFIDAEQVHADGRHQCPAPGARVGALAPQQPHDGDDHHIQAGDESRFSGGGVDQPHLLEGGAGEDGQPGQAAVKSRRLEWMRRRPSFLRAGFDCGK
jgi:hypothetical protein